MKRYTKKGNKINTETITKTNSLLNTTGRPWPMAPKAGFTLNRRRYQYGGKK